MLLPDRSIGDNNAGNGVDLLVVVLVVMMVVVLVVMLPMPLTTLLCKNFVSFIVIRFEFGRPKSRRTTTSFRAGSRRYPS
jgi:hypothetical protein